MARRRIKPNAGMDAVRAALAEGVAAAEFSTAVRFLLEELAEVAPGNSVEVRVPPLGATQCIEGPRHTRGTPPNTVEMSPETWFAVATGQLTWAEAVAQNLIAASGTRADLGDILPLGITRPTGLVE
ncbi:MAG: hypothetical protein RLZZ258_574 [Actinomycetota bacterium]|jgi:hypothetical protein